MTEPAPSLLVVGAGRAGLGIAYAVHAAGGRVIAIHGRHARGGGPLGNIAGPPLPVGLLGADVVLVAVRDRELPDALGEVRTACGDHRPVVLHASGSAPASGTFHPLVPLADPARAPELLRGAWIGIDGDERAIDAAQRLAALIGAHTLRIPSGAKARYHAAAVFASNFPTVLAALGERLMRDAGVDGIEARDAVRHLLSSAAANVAAGDIAAALTGPIVRGDVATIDAHRRALADDPIALGVYEALTRAALAILTND